VEGKKRDGSTSTCSIWGDGVIRQTRGFTSESAAYITLALMNSVGNVYRCPNCNAVISASSETCASCGASFYGPTSWKPKLEGEKETDVALPGFSFVIAEGFFFASLFELGALGWSRVSAAGASSHSLGGIALWAVFIAVWTIARCTVLAKLRLPRASVSIGLFRLSAVLLCLQVVALFFVFPIIVVILTPVTLGLPFILTLVANIRVIAAAARHEG
jgi:hypothetical protein